MKGKVIAMEKYLCWKSKPYETQSKHFRESRSQRSGFRIVGPQAIWNRSKTWHIGNENCFLPKKNGGLKVSTFPTLLLLIPLPPKVNFTNSYTTKKCSVRSCLAFKLIKNPFSSTMSCLKLLFGSQFCLGAIWHKFTG